MADAVGPLGEPARWARPVDDPDALAVDDTHPAALRLLERTHPDLFHVPHAPERVRMHVPACTIRHLVVAPPDRAADELPPDHSLRRLVEGEWPAQGALPDPLTP
ncbi:hypothetical protein [Saccharothrix yanglingensis]|uniref:Uncharacterized protein n=1 Tax=Saccharothrix yanglingensis TaxID=659496 RepID=A0ABU0WUW5_9PSEU|nr:hypothetical protein [Saccharothrix yanglingensis]MDQ2583651.1 hypothetical protein [Saccharothrix yanglingensis]